MPIIRYRKGGTMSKLMILMPNGYEEIEGLTVVDFCRRANIEIDMVSITGSLETLGDHKIKVMADKLVEDIDLKEKGRKE